MKYQLVIQFLEDALTYDEMVVLEDKLIDALENVAEVDGHDRGNGEINFFILTDEPKATFEECKPVLSSNVASMFRCAYRKTGEKNFEILWPLNLENFKIT